MKWNVIIAVIQVHFPALSVQSLQRAFTARNTHTHRKQQIKTQDRQCHANTQEIDRWKAEMEEGSCCIYATGDNFRFSEDIWQEVTDKKSIFWWLLFPSGLNLCPNCAVLMLHIRYHVNSSYFITMPNTWMTGFTNLENLLCFFLFGLFFTRKCWTELNPPWHHLFGSEQRVLIEKLFKKTLTCLCRKDSQNWPVKRRGWWLLFLPVSVGVHSHFRLRCTHIVSVSAELLLVMHSFPLSLNVTIPPFAPII